MTIGGKRSLLLNVYLETNDIELSDVLRFRRGSRRFLGDSVLIFLK